MDRPNSSKYFEGNQQDIDEMKEAHQNKLALYNDSFEQMLALHEFERKQWAQATAQLTEHHVRKTERLRE
jgi:hypothetical protein